MKQPKRTSKVISAVENYAKVLERHAAECAERGQSLPDAGSLLIAASITRLAAAVLCVGEILKEPAMCGVELKLGALVAVLAEKEERR